MDHLKTTPPEESKGDKNAWFAAYLVAASIFYFARDFNKSPLDGLIILIVAIGAGYFYHGLKRKVKIENQAARIAVTYFLLLVLSGFIVGFLTSIVSSLGLTT